MAAGTSFLKLVQELTNLDYCPPHPTTLCRSLDKRNTDTCQKLQEHIAKYMTTKFSLTFDHYKAKNREKFFMVMIWTLAVF